MGDGDLEEIELLPGAVGGVRRGDRPRRCERAHEQHGERQAAGRNRDSNHGIHPAWVTDEKWLERHSWTISALTRCAGGLSRSGASLSRRFQRRAAITVT